MSKKQRITAEERQAQIEHNIATGAATFFCPRGQVKKEYERILREKAAGTYTDNSAALIQRLLQK